MWEQAVCQCFHSYCGSTFTSVPITLYNGENFKDFHFALISPKKASNFFMTGFGQSLLRYSVAIS